MKYKVVIEKDGEGFLASFPDVPEALTGASTYEEVLSEAQGALLTAFEFFFEDMRPVPMPSAAAEGDTLITIPVSVWAKVLLLNTMLNEKVTQSELARRMNTRPQEMQRIVNLGHSTKIDTLATAMEAMGKSLILSIAS